jgi:peptide/nickel transport system substrate-binding protein
MRSTRLWASAGALAVLIALVVGGATTAIGKGSNDKSVLKIGWAQDPQTLNPFVGLDEEDFTAWALNWDLLVNFSPKDLSPTAGIAKSWTVSKDQRTITFKLDPTAKWSDGKPVTSGDVKWSLDVLGSNGALFTSYTDNITSIDTPDPHTVVIHTKRPDARIVGGLFIYILPKHIWGKVPVKDLTGTYQPKLPLVGSGPYVVTEFQQGHILTMKRNPLFRGPQPKYDEIDFIKYGNQDAVERALQLGEVDLVPEVSAANFARLGTQSNIDTFRAPAPAYTELSFNMCSKRYCPDAKFNPAIQDRAVRQAVGYAVNRARLNAIASRGTSFVANGILPSYYKSFYQQPKQDYPYDPAKAKRILDQAGWVENGGGPRTKGNETLSFNLYARSESPYTIEDAKLIAEAAAKVGIDFNVQVVSTDKLTELTTQKVNGKPAPDFDTFVWGWGGDPYDPSFLLSLLTTAEIGGSSDSFYSNPTYDRLFKQQAGVFDTAKRKALIERMVAIAQRDLPYLVLTYDPNLQAYRTDRISGVHPTCPDGTGDIFCEQISYEGLLPLGPASGESSGGGTSAGTVALIVIGAVVLAGIAFLVVRSRRRGRAEPVELEE